MNFKKRIKNISALCVLGLISASTAQAHIVPALIPIAVLHELGGYMLGVKDKATVRAAIDHSIAVIARKNNLPIKEQNLDTKLAYISPDDFDKVQKAALAVADQLKAAHLSVFNPRLKSDIRADRDYHNRWCDYIQKRHPGTSCTRVDVEASPSPDELARQAPRTEYSLRNEAFRTFPRAGMFDLPDHNAIIALKNREIPIEDRHVLKAREALIRLFAGDEFETGHDVGALWLYSEIGSPLDLTEEQVAASVIYMVHHDYLRKRALDARAAAVKAKRSRKNISVPASVTWP